MINKRLLSLCSDSKRYIILSIFAKYLDLLCNIGIIYLIAYVINNIYNKMTMNTFFIAVCFMATLIVRFIANYCESIFSYKATYSAKKTLRTKAYEKLFSLGVSYESDISTGEIVQSIGEGVELLDNYFGKYIPQIFFALLSPITLFILISQISLKTALVLIAGVPLIPLSIVAFMKIAKKVMKKYWNNYSDLGGSFLESLHGLTTLKLFRVDKKQQQKIKHESEKFRKMTMKVLSVQLNSITIMDIIAYGGAGFGSIIALLYMKSGNIDIGQMIIIILLSASFFIPLRQLGAFFHVATTSMAAADKIFEILDIQETVVENHTKLNYVEHIKANKLSFSYKDKVKVLKDIDFEVSKNETVAFVGESGSGKSTIAKLLVKMFSPDYARISINGIDMNDLDACEITKHINLISSDSYIFNTTIRENLCVAKSDASELEIMDALKTAQLYDFVQSLEYKLDTKAGEAGAMFSGGQKQRLAFARSILANRDVLILDEATSNVDSESEELIFKAVDALRGHKTMIIISHRLENIKNADRIYLIKNGQIVEKGTHKDLENQKGDYYKMLQKQQELEDVRKGAGLMKDKSDASVFIRMIKELKNLTPIMLLTILFGVCGFLAATAIPVVSSVVAVGFISDEITISLKIGIMIIAVCAVSRGLLHYAEQLSGHFIAFKILAILRGKIFEKLRALAPAKLDTKEKGNIISVITSDIELMEVFYAHTIAPFMIGIFTSLIYSLVLFKIHFVYGVLAAIYYIILGFILPINLKNASKKIGSEAREAFGKSNSFLLDSLRGLKEIIFFNNQKKVLADMDKNSAIYSKNISRLKKREGIGMSLTNLIISLGIIINLIIGYNLMMASEISLSGLIIALVLFASSFGPVIALSMLSTSLSTSLASAKRVFDILDEKPYVIEVKGNTNIKTEKVDFNDITFSYPNRIGNVIDRCTLSIGEKGKVAIVGESGCGKSTLIKLLMRYYDVDKGDVAINKISVSKIPTDALRDIIGYTSQDTFLFQGTIENNIRLGNSDASFDDVVKAAKKASVHDDIMGFEKEYSTQAGELGSRLSSGEKQRIALARLFLKDSDILIFDEPTSNLDVLNEGEILKSINEHCEDKSIIMISHRSTTTGICDKIYRMDKGKLKQISV